MPVAAPFDENSQVPQLCGDTRHGPSLSRLSACAFVISCTPLATQIEIAVWLQPTLVGLLWGALFVGGFFLGGLQRGRLFSALGTAACCWLFGSCFYWLTDLNASDCLLAVTLICSGGWLTARLDYYYYRRASLVLPSNGLRQWSISDVAMLTWGVACLTHALSNLTAPPILLIAVLLVLLAGLALSWIAYRWAWTDDWSFRRMLALIVTLGLLTFAMFSLVPTGMTMLQAAVWMLAGPINVIVAQAVAVLFALALARFDMRFDMAQGYARHQPESVTKFGTA